MVNAPSQKRRERILTATADLIRRDGVSALTTKKIAAEAGCAEGTIFRHFGDKGGLIAAVLSFGLPEIYHLEAVAHQPVARDLETGLIELCTAVYDYYRASYPIAAGALADAEIFRRYQAAHRAAGTGPRQIWGFVSDYLTAARDAGQVREDADVEIEALTIAGACQNAAWVGLVNGDDALPHDGEGFIARLVAARIVSLRAVPRA